MRSLPALAAVVLLAAAPAGAADPLAEARRSYNLGQYDTAARYAREALRVPATAENARLVLGRIHLEQFRRTADSADLAAAREALREVDATGLGQRERAELLVGLAECLYLEDRFGPASEFFERALEAAAALGPAAYDRVLDWWATSLDRLALMHPREAREPFYARIVSRMEKEIAANASSGPASYWLPAALRGAGQLERAWHAASAGWVAAALARDRGAALRADLDRLVTNGIIPERALRIQPGDPKQAGTSMAAEWEALKAAYSR